MGGSGPSVLTHQGAPVARFPGLYRYGVGVLYDGTHFLATAWARGCGRRRKLYHPFGDSDFFWQASRRRRHLMTQAEIIRLGFEQVCGVELVDLVIKCPLNGGYELVP